MSQSLRTFGISQRAVTWQADRWLFAHIQMMEFRPRYGGAARGLRITAFIGNGAEEVVTMVGRPFDSHCFDSTGDDPIRKEYQAKRKRLQGLPWLTCHQRASKCDWLFRATLPTTGHEILTWGNALAEFGFDRERFAELMRWRNEN